ncbi:MAG: DUF1864 family protein [Ardenticatenaceae bacterium]|nr:DUF1864 family protein [Ardenticatenaceae bacterium]
MHQFEPSEPIQPVGSQDIYSFIDRSKQWVLDNLPLMNGDVQAGILSLQEMACLIQPLVTEAQYLLANYELEDLWMARMLIQPLGFLISSLEKHYQERQHTAGTALRHLKGAEDLLFQLGKVANHPPRDSHYTNYLWNVVAPPLTYTGDPQEVFFVRSVTRTNELHEDSYNALLSICKGELSTESDDVCDAIKHATKNILAVRDIYRSFFHKDEKGVRNMDFDFFVQLRTFKPPFPIKGINWTGANAGNLAVQMCLDYLIGTVMAEHSDFIDTRLRLLVGEDQAAIQAAKQQPSLLDRLLKRLRLTHDEVQHWDDEKMIHYFHQQDFGLQHAITAYGELVKAAGEMSAIHWSLIQNYIVRPGKRLATEGSRLAVSPEIGLTNTPHEKIKQIMEMRRNHPKINRLLILLG